MKSLRAILFLCLLLTSGGLMAQESSLIKKKTTRIIAKLDLYWSAVVIAENFPTFFPVELEVNFPSPRFSVELIASPWGRTYSSQTRTYHETSFSGGIGLRYYPFKSTFPDAATGFFVEPQYLMRYTSTDVDSLSVRTETVKDFSGGLFLGVGYQHQFLDWLYLQGRVSVGMGRDEALESYQVGTKLTVLPWVGIGIGLH
jgi:hypothetical protein